ncbi:putative 37s ribosomal protein rsm22 [Golovinomyces cichoracearum]|uniref:Putative 37s ribosomal protein rsm22 n=1 Tax=Golovinomyces cichoracearum TaxID=62708 RepID=A0A420HJE9_9PEZI|nr:putative 37s ribosomal protein rsm22 [Golovinomyces cichoracearum]
MSSTVYPYLSEEKLKIAEKESAAKELFWLLGSFEETFLALKNGVEECHALFAPAHRGSTLVLSSPRSESIKGHITRVGSQIVKGTINLRLRTHAPLNLMISPISSDAKTKIDGFRLPSLSTLCKLLDQSLECLESTRFPVADTGTEETAISLDINSDSSHIYSQLRLLHSFFQESLLILKGSDLPSKSGPSDKTSHYAKAWHLEPLQSDLFIPELPSTLALDISIRECSLLLTIRVLEPCSQSPTLSSIFLTGIGAQRRLEHDEMNHEFLYRGEMVRVKEKCRIESSADPFLLSCAAKLQVLERSVLGAMEALRTVLGCEEKE